jgi:exopolysaccharide biosynthesis polyprenyl glycosylphosphotransferase
MTDPTTPRADRRPRLQASEHRALLALGDLGAAALAVVVSLALWTMTAGVGMGEAFRTRGWWFLAAVAWSLGMAPARDARRALSIPATLRAVVRLAVALLAFYLAVYFYAPRQSLPRLLALYFAWEASLLTAAWRFVYVRLATEGGVARRMIIVGSGPEAAALVESVRAADLPDAEIVGAIVDPAAGGSAPAQDIPVLGGVEALPGAALEAHASHVVLATRLDDGPIVDRLLACAEAGILVVPMAVVYEQLLERVPVRHVGPDWLFTSYAEAVSARDASELARRAVDLAGGLVGAALLLAVMPWVALAVWLDSGRPIFYRQARVGRGGRPFQLLKFRTMVPEAEADGPRWAGAADPRVTRVGRWLRRSRLDELPNVLAVLRGDLSLVGPRPERIEFVAALEHAVPMYRARQVARPGLTGWAQINYPYGDSVDDAIIKLEYDLYYLKHRSASFDVWIALRTVLTVLSLGGR